MDNSDGQQPERLEDQLRKMILNNGQPPMHPNSAPQPNQPPRQSPPPTSCQTSNSYYFSGAPYRNHFPEHQAPTVGRITSIGLPERPPSLPQPNQSTPNFPYQNGRHQQPYHQNQRGNYGTHQPPQQLNNRRPAASNPAQNQRGRYQRQMPLDPDVFHRNNFGPPYRTQGQPRQQLFNPNGPPQKPMAPPYTDQHARQSQYLDQLAVNEIRTAEMSSSEQREKEKFRLALGKICREVCDSNSERLPKVNLECFGSFKSGFATAGSDMDLVIVVRDPILANSQSASTFSVFEDDLPRVLEKRLLQMGYGARLLTRTRVPILKVCENPDVSFLDKLREEREKWDALDDEAKYPHLYQKEEEAVVQDDAAAKGDAEEQGAIDVLVDANQINLAAQGRIAKPIAKAQVNGVTHSPTESNRIVNGSKAPSQNQQNDGKAWMREKKAGPLDFPKSGVGIQSDINFSNPLGLHNTQLLRCYCLCDPRVRPMVLFVKAWAKRRKINSSYSGTLSSYGYVLMVLHYLVNVAQPPVLPNLQSPWRPAGVAPANATATEVVDNWTVSFWRNELEISTSAHRHLLTTNRETLGSLLAGFFTYYSSLGGGRQFRWMQEVLSLRSYASNGLLTKEEKGWVKAVTEEGDGRKIQHRYLFCIEDPFELGHNVARTVTHRGIVAVRDEFRRARRILQAVGMGVPGKDGELMAQLVEEEEVKTPPGEVRANSAQSGAANSANGSTVKSTPPAQHGGTQKTPATSPRHNNNHGTNGKPQPPSTQQQQPQRNAKPRLHPPQSLPPKSKTLDVEDNETFPSLGGGKPAKKRAGRSVPQDGEGKEEFSEISGEKAQAILQEVKRKRDEAQAEVTATGAAEAVLNGID